MSQLAIKNLTKAYGSFKVFDGFNLSAEAGEIVVIFGGSGTGKTILLRLIAGVEDASGKRVFSVTEAGTIAWNKDYISLAEFIDRLRAYKAAEPEGRILINGDEGALFNAALYVFDEARKTGFQKIFIETKVRNQGR